MSFAADLAVQKKWVRAVVAGTAMFLSTVAWSADAIVPNAPVDIVEWAADKIIIPSEVSERTGPCELPPFQASILRMGQANSTRQLTHKKPPRIGSSLLTAIEILYYACHEGQPCIYYERSDDKAQDFHDKVLMPILMASPKLSHLVRPRTKAGVQDAWSDIILRNGAAIQLRSASNNGSFRGIKGSKIFCDEVSSKEWRDLSKHSEGSKLGLARRRSQQYAAPMMHIGSTPTKKGECVVSIEFLRSDQRVYVMSCPRCQEAITFDPDVREAASRHVHSGAGLRYTKNEHRHVTDVWYECGKCHGCIEPTEKAAMLDAGQWVVTNPFGEEGHVGIWNWAAHSMDPRSDWREIAKEHIKALADPAAMVEFTNTILALEWDAAPPVVVDPSFLTANKLALPPGIDCPADTVFLVAAGDNQRGRRDDPLNPPRGEYTVVAVCSNGRLHVVCHVIISHLVYGKDKRIGIDPFEADYAEAAWAILDRDYVAADGRLLRIRRTLVDCGWQQELAWKFCTLPRSKNLGILPMKGDATERLGRKVSLLPNGAALRAVTKGKNKGKRAFLYVGTRDAKDEVARRLAIPYPGPGSISYAADLPDSYFDGLLAQRLVDARPGLQVWTDVGSNTGEPWDCLQYAYAARETLLMNNRRLRAEVEDVDPDLLESMLAAKVAAQDAAAPPAPPAAADDADLADAAPVHYPGAEEGEAPAQTSGRPRLVVRKVRRDETSPDRQERIDRIRRRSARSGVGW